MENKNFVFVPDNVKLIHNVLCHKNYECHLVGGCVRDALLGEVPHDYDLCTNANPDAVQELLKETGIRSSCVGIQYGTVVALLNQDQYEITTYRTESEYLDGRHPNKVDFTKNINDDLARRDFTINAMAFDLDRNTIVDPYCGMEDLKNRIIRMVGDPNERIKEDPLRILRGLRFAIRYGFSIDDKTKEAFLNNKHFLSFVAKERVTNEFKKMFSYNKPITSVFLEYAPIIFELIPELRPCYKFEQNNKYHKHDVYEHLLHVVDGCDTDKFEIKLAALLHDVGKPASYVTDKQGNGHFYGHANISYEMSKDILSKDFRVTVQEREKLLFLIREHDHEMPITTKSVRKFVSDFGEDYINDWMILKKGDISDHLNPDPERSLPDKYLMMLDTYQNFIENESRFSLKDLNVNGLDMISLELKGSSIGDTLNYLLNNVINEITQNNHDELIKAAIKYNHIENDKYNDLFYECEPELEEAL